tara:strand:- start:746 stop:1210 length:465 start_codon:yes stop_codon:yes gene_type:complete
MICDIDPSHLPLEGLCLQAMQWHASVDGQLDRTQTDQLTTIINHSHLSVIRHDASAPVLFYVGLQSPAAQVYGADWASSALGQVGIPDTEAERTYNAAYFDVATSRQIRTHICKGTFQSDNGATDLFYFRTLLPVETRNSRLILCVADLIQSSN